MVKKRSTKNYTQRNISIEWAFLLHRYYESAFI